MSITSNKFSQEQRDLHRLRVREVEVQEHLVYLKQQELAQNRRAGPLVVAVVALVLTGLGNLVVLWRNGEIEKTKAENERILEIIKTGDQARAVKNIEFLLDTDLVSGDSRAAKLREYLSKLKPGEGPVLPVQWIDQATADYKYNPMSYSFNINTAVTRPKAAEPAGR